MTVARVLGVGPLAPGGVWRHRRGRVAQCDLDPLDACTPMNPQRRGAVPWPVRPDAGGSAPAGPHLVVLTLIATCDPRSGSPATEPGGTAPRGAEEENLLG